MNQQTYALPSTSGAIALMVDVCVHTTVFTTRASARIVSQNPTSRTVGSSTVCTVGAPAPTVNDTVEAFTHGAFARVVAPLTSATTGVCARMVYDLSNSLMGHTRERRNAVAVFCLSLRECPSAGVIVNAVLLPEISPLARSRQQGSSSFSYFVPGVGTSISNDPCRAQC